MYHFPGEYVTDFCIVHHQGLYHLFHIRGERWTWPVGYRELDLGHATSTDLRAWTPHPPVLPAGPAGSWDECGNWAPDIIEKDGIFHCFYTGSDRNNNQAIGLATSPDLFAWEKYGHNPVVVPGPWSDLAVGRDVAGRDAMVFHDQQDGRYLLYYTATMSDGHACLALAQSDNLIDWADLGPTYIEEDRTYNRLESPYLVQQGERYYLFYSAKGGPKSKGFSPRDFAHFDIVYQVSDNPTGGWSKPANHLLIEGTTCASEHPTFDGTTYMLYIIQEEIEGVWGASVLSDPKRIEWLADGTVRIREHLPESVHVQTLYDSSTTVLFVGSTPSATTNISPGVADWVQHGGMWYETIGDTTRASAEVLRLITAPGGKDEAFLMNTRWGTDLALTAEIWSAGAGIGSLVVRANPSALAGYRVSLDFGRQVVGFHLLFPGREAQTIQERPVSLQPEAWHRVKVVVQGKFFEIYVDDNLTIVHDQRVYEEGCFGLHAQGAIQFRNVYAAAMPPTPATLPWSQRVRPRHLFP